MMNNEDSLLVIDRFCDKYESQLKSGQSTDFEEIYESAKIELRDDKVCQSLLSELIALRIVYSDDRKATADSLRKKYPDLVQNIDEALCQPSLLGTVGDSLRRTAVEENAAGPGPVASIANVGLRFENLTHHASGGLGDVYIGFDKAVSRRVAIKLLKPKLVFSGQAKNRFLNEGSITGMLEHPGIVPVYDSGVTEDGQPYYAMRLLEGQTLNDAIAELHGSSGRGDFVERQRSLLRSLTQVCDAVSCAHDNGVIHRDIKPANILLGKYGETMLIDWGLARKRNSCESKATADSETANANPNASADSATNAVETQMGQVIGTPAFMSPEQAGGDPTSVGELSDVYSLGSVLYCILTGQPPIAGADVMDRGLVEVIQTGKFPSARQRNAAVPQSLCAICERAMNLDPDLRYVSPKALASDIENWLEDQPIAAHPDRIGAKLSRFVRKHRKWTAAAAITLVAITIGSLIAATVISGQSAELSRRKSEAEKLSILQKELATQAKQSADEAIDANRNNSAYVRFMNKVFEQLRTENVHRSNEAKDVRLTDLIDAMSVKLEQERETIPLRAQREVLENIVTSLNAAGQSEQALVHTEELIDIVSEEFGPNSLQVIDAKGALTHSLLATGRPREAVDLSEETLGLIRSNQFTSEEQVRIGEIQESVLVRRIAGLEQLARWDEAIATRKMRFPWLEDVRLNALPQDAVKLQVISQHINA